MSLVSVGLDEEQGPGEYLCPQIGLFYEALL